MVHSGVISSSSKKTLRILAIFLFGKCGKSYHKCMVFYEELALLGTISWPAENILIAMKLNGAFWRVLRPMLYDF